MAILSSSKLILCLIFFSTTTTTHIQTPDHHLLATFLLSQQRMCMNVKRMLYNHPLRMITSTKNIRKKKTIFYFLSSPPLPFFFFFFYDFGSHTLSVKERVSTIIPETFLLLKDCKSQTSFIVLFSSSDAHHYLRVHKHSQPDAVPLLITLPGQPLLKCFQTTV